MNKILILRLLTILLFVVLGSVGVYRINNTDKLIDTSINSVLPEDSFTNSDFSYFQEMVSRELIYLISSDNEEAATKAVSEVRSLLGSFSELKMTSFTDTKAMAEFYYKHKYAYTSLPYVHKGASLDNKAVEQLNEAVDNALFSPIGGYSSYELEYDPFMTMRTLVAKQAKDFKISEQGNLFVERDGKKFYIINAYLVEKLNNIKRDELAKTSLALKEKLSSENVDLFYTGESYFTQAATEASVNDMSRIGWVSTIVLVLLLVLAYRGVCPLLLTLITLGISLLAGFLAVIIGFGSIHTMTLAMGSCLIGICVDYCIHVFTAKSEEACGEKVRSVLKTPLLFSLATSMLAYLVLVFTNLLVLKELALFALVALSSTFLIVFAFITSLKLKVTPNFIIARAVLWLLIKTPRATVLFFACFSFLMWLFGVSQMDGDDDVAHMQEKNSTLISMNNHIQQVLSGYEHVANYIITGRDLQDALENCEQLEFDVASDLLNGVFMPCKLIPSARTQQSQQEAFIEMYPLLEKKFAQQQLTINEMAKPTLLAEFSFKDYPKDIHAFFANHSVLLRVNADNKDLAKNLAELPYVEKMDQRSLWSTVFAKFRIELNWALIIAFGLAVMAIIPLFKKFTFSRFVLPMLGGCGCGLVACIFIASGYFNLFTTLALFMLLGLGADYCVFMHQMNKENSLQVLQSITVSCLTTEASFGALAFSATAVISSFGIVISFGLLGIVLLVMLLRVTLNKEVFNDLP
jgi:predicted exporter